MLHITYFDDIADDIMFSYIFRNVSLEGWYAGRGFTCECVHSHGMPIRLRKPYALHTLVDLRYRSP